jgi:D-alanine--poly(phosphoribitol) ligase subunit 1
MKIPDFLCHAPFSCDYDAGRIAVAGSNGELTYRQFFDLVDACREALFKAGLRKGNPIFIYGHKEKEIPALMVAAIDAGMPYIPVDPGFPEGRVRAMMEACGGGFFINVMEENATSLALSMHGFEALLSNGISQQSRLPDLNHKFSQKLAYILFTSGTTGQPKGVCISHSNLISFVSWLKNDYPYSAGEVMFNHALFTFDVSLYDVFGALLTGGTMVLNSKDVLNNPPAAVSRMKHYACTVWTSTPALAHIFLLHDDFNGEQLPHIKNFVFAGEPLPAKTIQKLHERFPGRGVYNAYGPTEATVTTTLVTITPEILGRYSAGPVGYPRSGNSVFISNADSDNKAEVIICGDHVSPGYLNRDDLNQLKFFDADGRRAYRSGDCGYFEEGLLFLTGRIDEQIKFNGYRIEPAEVESVLLRALPDDSSVSVIPLKRGAEVKRIIAMVCLQHHAPKPDMDEVSLFLLNNLPAYMMPSEFFFVSHWPLNASGKTDKEALLHLYLSAQS